MGDPHTAWLHFGRHRFEAALLKGTFVFWMDFANVFCCVKLSEVDLKESARTSTVGVPWGARSHQQEMRGLNANNEAMVDELVDA